MVTQLFLSNTTSSNTTSLNSRVYVTYAYEHGLKQKWYVCHVLSTVLPYCGVLVCNDITRSCYAVPCRTVQCRATMCHYPSIHHKVYCMVAWCTIPCVSYTI